MILVTGGTGYIGSHTVVELLAAGEEVLILDNLCNSTAGVVDRIAGIAGRRPALVVGDIRDAALLTRLLREHPVRAVMHFAGLKAVGESVQEPLAYYDNNVAGTLRLLEAMDQTGVRKLVFSSSATVYGDPHSLPIQEHFPLQATNPYGRTKLHIEEMLRDLSRADPRWQIAILRYFNPVGAHPSGLIGESPQGVPNNLMPYVTQVALGLRSQVNVFGQDYPTPDGTGVRDFIHVVDLARGHLAALAKLSPQHPMLCVNLGTGRGYSVLELIAALERASGRPVPYRIADRRPGDIAACYADPTLARELLGWQAQLGLEAMCEDAWRWQSASPAAEPTQSR
ncbi:MAG: UDP-glucose 4-epimerase GalE [Azonexus sp.]|nr:UDP-glucose 4-epimerase GalE [Betaproteobacteria bacterium]MBK8918944.1 UDP-glucose 4-epimerase GalE [Betaproteobacteria bacterium]MBP6035758.1 UDP-glucose 4-epimerase GalE [Azonexus sp.]MBP6905395.1 UDP-glucose 4-epimerase GalE [Azonexus sp.]